MEFDIGTLIYIIITIVAIVAGAFGNKKKPASNKPGASEKSSSGSFFERMEERIGGFVDEAKESVQSVADEFIPSDEDSQTYNAEDTGDQGATYIAEDADGRDSGLEAYDDVEGYPEYDYNDFEGIYNPEKEKNLDLITQEAERSTSESDALKVIEMEEGSHPDYFEIVSDFDLETAVIYSTIINRIDY